MPKGIRYGGRQKGTPNRFTAQFRDALRIVYDDIGGHEAFAAWARENRGDFYRIMAKLIPAETIQHNKAADALRIVLVGFREEGGRIVEVLPESEAELGTSPPLLADD